MGIFTKGVKEVVKKQISETKPKKEISPLVKQTEDIFVSSDPEIYTRMSDDARSVLEKEFGDVPTKTEEVIGRLYSPVYSAIENMPIGKGGTKGENISAYLQKRAPNVDKAELQSFDLNLDPKRLYTREEVLNLAKQKGSPDYTIEKQRYTEYKDSQRQGVMDAEEDYVELTVEGKQEYTVSPSSVHLGRKSNLGHTRSSIRREAPTQLQQKIVDRPRYLLIEEIQSDLAKRRGEDGRIEPSVFEVDEDRYDSFMENTFNNLMDSAEDYSVTVDKDLRNAVNEIVTDIFSPDNVDIIEDIKINNEDKTYIRNLKDEVKKITGREPVGDTVLKVANHALIDNADFSQVSRSDFYDPEIQYEASDLQQLYIEDVNDEFTSVYNKLNSMYSQKENYEKIKKLPVASRSDYVKRLLLANIAYAKRNGINKIVIPNPREIAKQRTDSFDEILGIDEQLFKAYEEASKKKGFNQDEFATDYFEKVFTPLYKDAVTKVLNSLKSETKGKIKYGTKELKYRGPYKEDAQGRLTNTRLPYKADAIEIDITDFEFNPEAQGLRFNEGGAVPMQEQMKLFNEGGLKDEGGSVDPVSGNDVPIGSTQEEVRDDIPAMLSEGEFVFPADVVRYIGLEKLMQLRQEAKMGLKQMEAMGQMGNSEEATMPDDLPFNMADLIIVAGDSEEPKEMAQGGVVHMSNGGYLPKFVDQGVETAPINIESFDTTLSDPDFSNVKRYVNKEGKVRFIPFGPDGKPLYPIPVGFFPEGELPEDTPTETEEAIPTTDTDSGGGGGSRQVKRSAFQEAGSWTGSPLDMYIKEADKVTTYGNVASGVGAALNPLIGGFMSIAVKNEKRKILATIDDRIKQAKTEEQKKELEDIKERLTNPERKGILSKAINSIFGGIADSLGLSEEEQKVATATTNTIVNQSTEESNEQSQDNINMTTDQMLKGDSGTPTTTDYMLKGDSGTPVSNELLISDRVGIPTKRLPLVSDRVGVQTGDQPDLLSTTDQMLKGDSGTPTTTDYMLKGDSGTFPTTDQMLKGDVGTALGSLTTTDQMLKGDSGSITYLADAFRKISDKYENLQLDRAEEIRQNLTDRLFSTLESENKYTDPMGDNEFKASTSISDITRGELPTESDIEKYLSSVSDDDDDDKPKKDTSAKDRRDRRQNQKRFKDAATKARRKDAIDGGSYKVFKDAYDSGASAERLESIDKERKKIREKLEDMEKGIITGFAKGGLASRKKK
jgi:hypothetical protein